MNILVLGAKGFIGKALVEKLKENPENDVMEVDRDSINLLKPTYCGMLSNLPFDIVYQLAADSGNKRYLESSDYDYGNSTRINLNILKALKPENVGTLIFTSSFYARYPEDSYGLEKRFNEELFIRSKFNTKIARLYPVYDLEKHEGKDEKLLNGLCRSIVNQPIYKPLQINVDKYFRSFCYLPDVIKMLMQLPEIKSDKYVYNITQSAFYTICHLASIIKQESKQYDLNIIVNDIEAYLPHNFINPNEGLIELDGIDFYGAIKQLVKLYQKESNEG